MQNLPFHIKDIDGYVFFSDKTTGNSGKPVKIHTSLFVDFFCAVDLTTHDGQTVVRDIESLKVLAKANSIQPLPLPKGNASSAKHNEQMSKVRGINNAMAGTLECSLVTKNIRAFYKIHQNTGDICPTVYITEVQILQGGRDQVGGLYEEKASSYGNRYIKLESSNLEGKAVVISKATDTVKEAMEAAKAALATDPTKIDKNTNKPYPKTQVALFFNPKSIAGDLSLSRDNRLTPSTKKLVDELTKVIKDNQRKSVSWLVEGEGASVLAHALKGVPGSLDKHSFHFSNAKANLPALMNALSERKAQLKDEFINYGNDKAALLAIAIQKQALLNQLKQIGGAVGYEKITRRYLIERLDALGSTGAAQHVVSQKDALRTSKATFINALLTAGRNFK